MVTQKNISLYHCTILGQIQKKIRSIGDGLGAHNAYIDSQKQVDTRKKG